MRFVGRQLKPFSFTQCSLGLLFSVCILALATGCEQVGSPRDTGAESLVPEKMEDSQVTAAEAEKFTKKYLSAVKRQNKVKLLQLVDWDVIVDRIFSDQSTNTDFYKAYASGGKKILGQFAKGVDIEIGGGGSYAFLKTVLRGKDRHAIFRLVTGTSSPAGGGLVNYHNLRLIKRKGQVLADDIYIARIGSWLSENYRTNLRPVMLKNEKSTLGYTSEQKIELESYKLIADMIEASRSGNSSEASKIYQQLPEDTQKSKAVLGSRMLATDREEFFKAAEAMLVEYPGSTAVALNFMDFGARQKDLPTLNRASEMLAKWTGGDSYIDLVVAAGMSNLGEVDKASELSKEIDVKRFDFANPVFLKFNIAVAAKDNETILECLRSLRDDHDKNIKEILKADVCKHFIESIEYADLKSD